MNVRAAERVLITAFIHRSRIRADRTKLAIARCTSEQAQIDENRCDDRRRVRSRTSKEGEAHGRREGQER
ncbi:MAG TPA: hypothetical protein VKB71_15200, partial [Rhizomicrobium sp.]|nr:hypothetical protein [Rhizomicrobium sp.]